MMKCAATDESEIASRAHTGYTQKEIAYWRGASTGAPSLAYEDNVSRGTVLLSLPATSMQLMACLHPRHVAFASSPTARGACTART